MEVKNEADQARQDRLTRELREQINDLMTSLHVLTPLVKERGTKRDEENLAIMNKSLYRMVRTVRHMDMCWGETPALRCRLTDLSRLCAGLCRQVEGIAGELKASFQWEGAEEGDLSMADPELLEMALLNLLSNAFRGAGPGGHVGMSWTGTRERFTVTVWDDGTGLEQTREDSPLLRQACGVGLGLDTARKAATLHKGTLVLGAGEGAGVRAVLSIPIDLPARPKILRSPDMALESGGGLSQLLVEFSDLLPYRCFSAEDVD